MRLFTATLAIETNTFPPLPYTKVERPIWPLDLDAKPRGLIFQVFRIARFQVRHKPHFAGSTPLL